MSGATLQMTALSGGTATVTATARDPGGLTASLSFTATVMLPSSPDLVVSVTPARVTVAPGGSFEFETTIRNQGDAASPATSVRTLGSTDATITTSDEQIGDPDDVPRIGAGQSAGGTFHMTVASSAPPATVYLGQCVDAVQGELNTGNNCSNAIRVTIGSSGNDTTYTVGQTIPSLPTGRWFPSRSGGGIQLEISGNTTRVTANNDGYFEYGSHRFTCRSSGGCQVSGRQVTRGSWRQTPKPSSGPSSAASRVLASSGGVEFRVSGPSSAATSVPAPLGKVHRVRFLVGTER